MINKRKQSEVESSSFCDSICHLTYSLMLWKKLSCVNKINNEQKLAGFLVEIDPLALSLIFSSILL